MAAHIALRCRRPAVRTARVRAMNEVRVLAVERVSFERLCAENEGLADRIGALGEQL